MVGNIFRRRKKYTNLTTLKGVEFLSTTTQVVKKVHRKGALAENLEFFLKNLENFEFRTKKSTFNP